jgi:hypothetical protein
MNIFKDFINTKFPHLAPFLIQVMNRLSSLLLSFRSPKAIFTDIYKRNTWGSPDSISGPGSNMQQTATIILELPKIIAEFEVKSILDLPCGDFFWMRTVDIGKVTYTGGDIVEELIINNNMKFTNPERQFIILDILKDQLPTVDLIFCRDCLVHLSLRDIQRALNNFKASNSKYLITTTFTRSDKFMDIATGQWRPINLQLFPFNFPKPIKIINENCTWGNGAFSDKCLGIWKVSDLPASADKSHV